MEDLEHIGMRSRRTPNFGTFDEQGEAIPADHVNDLRSRPLAPAARGFDRPAAASAGLRGGKKGTLRMAHCGCLNSLWASADLNQPQVVFAPPKASQNAWETENVDEATLLTGPGAGGPMAPSTARDSRPGGSKAVALMSEACGELGTEGKQACSRAAAAAKAVAGQACDQASNAGRACVKTSTAGGKACVKAAAGLKADVDKVTAALRSWWRSLAPPQPGEGSAGAAAAAAQSSGSSSLVASGVAPDSPRPSDASQAPPAGCAACETAAAAVRRACGGHPGCVRLAQCGERAGSHVAALLRPAWSRWKLMAEARVGGGSEAAGSGGGGGGVSGGAPGGEGDVRLDGEEVSGEGAGQGHAAGQQLQQLRRSLRALEAEEKALRAAARESETKRERAEESASSERDARRRAEARCGTHALRAHRARRTRRMHALHARRAECRCGMRVASPARSLTPRGRCSLAARACAPPYAPLRTLPHRLSACVLPCVAVPAS